MEKLSVKVQLNKSPRKQTSPRRRGFLGVYAAGRCFI